MKPFFQGKLDVFCAIYAVLNGLKITHQIRTLQARDILHEALLGLSVSQDAFRAVLEQRTDYVALVDGILNIQKHKLALRVEAPFAELAPQDTPSPDAVWAHAQEWFKGGEQRAVVFRFLRYMAPGVPPLNRHWTTARCITDHVMHFFDCSLEAEAVYSIKRGGFVTQTRHISTDCLLCVEPASMRFLAPRC